MFISHVGSSKQVTKSCGESCWTPKSVHLIILITGGGVVITPLTFRSERCYFMKSGSERCYSGHSRLLF